MTASLITPAAFTVPEGWSKGLDVPGSVNLDSADFAEGLIAIIPDWAVASQSECTPQPEPGLGRSVADLVAFVTEHPGLSATTPEPVTVGGLSGQVVEIEKIPDWDGPCPGTVSLFTHTGTIGDPGWWDIDDSMRMRLHFLDLGEGRTVTVHVDTFDAATFDEFVQASAPIVESLAFTVNIGTVTVTDSECRLVLATQTPSAGELIATVVNDSSVQAGVDAFRVSDMAALTAHVEEEARRADAGEPVLGHPAAAVAEFASAGSGLVDPGMTSIVEIDAEKAGSYALICLRYHENTSDPVRPFAVVGPIEVGGASAVTPSARGYHRLVAAGTGIMLLGGFRAPGPVNESTLVPDPAWILESDGWTKLDLTDPPIQEAVYDSFSEQVVLLAPNNPVLAPQLTGPTTFSYERMSATAIQMGSGGPEGLIGVRAVYDPAADRIIAFGGWNLGPSFSDRTWMYDVDRDNWGDRNPKASPEGRNFHEMVYVGGRVILFGGGTESKSFGDTWAYSYESNTWTNVANDGPPPRSYHAMAYDPTQHRLILFGGVTGASEEPLADTWQFDLEIDTWRKITTVDSPSARGWHAMTFDASSARIVLFGGGPSRTEYNAETWYFDVSADTWSRGG